MPAACGRSHRGQTGARRHLCEASDSLGGAIRYAKHVPFKKYLDDYLHYLIRQVGRAGVQVRLGARVTPDLAEALAPDVLIAAVGARPIVPKLPGMDPAPRGSWAARPMR